MSVKISNLIEDKRLIMRLFQTILFLFFILSICYAQEITFRTLTTDNGLSQNDVNDIIQDSRGFMWFATYDGLNKYDGYEFTVYRSSATNTNTICGNLIHSVMEGYNSDLWVTTENSGLSRIDLITDKVLSIRNTEEEPGLLISNRLGDVICYPYGHIWVQTMRGLNYIKYNPDGSYSAGDFQREAFGKILERKRIRALTKISDTSIMMVTHGGLITVNLNNLYEPTYDFSLIKHTHNTFECAITCTEGYLLGMIDGLYLLRFENRQGNIYHITKLSDIVPTAMSIDADEQLWVGTTDGIYLFSHHPTDTLPYKLLNHYTTINTNLTSNYIRCIYSDNTGIIWIGTSGGGICILDRNKPKFRHYPYITDIDNQNYKLRIRVIYQDNLKNLWIGSDNRELFYLPYKSDKDYSKHYHRIEPNKNSPWHGVYDIADVHTQQGNFIWIGSSYNNVLSSMNPPKNGIVNRPKPIDNIEGMVFQIIQDSDSLIWIATYWGGLYRYDPYDKKGGFKFFNEKNSSLPSSIIRNVMEDHKGRIWIGTSQGLCLLPKEDKRKDSLNLTIFNANANIPGSISHNYILPICQTRSGEIWIGTMGGGINKYVENDPKLPNHFIKITTENGLPNDVIKDIVEDNQEYLWIATNKGLSRFNPLSMEITNYDKNDGLQDNEFGELAGCKLNDGEILFGGVHGFNAFYPKNISLDTTLPKIVLTRFQIMGNDVHINDTINNRVILTKQLNETSTIHLKSSENNFTIHFSGMHYSSPLKNQYQYFLKGFDKQWIYTDAHSRFAKYTNLKPGTYTFRVVASNANNKWNTKAKEIHFVIRPPFWQSWAFRITAVILTIMLLFGIYRFRVRQLTNELNRRKEHERILTTAKLKAEESDNLKSSIIANISHEIRTPINGILGFSELLSSETLAPDKRKRYTKIVRQKGRELVKILDSVIMLSAAQAGGVSLRTRKQPVTTIINAAYSNAVEKIQTLEKPIEVLIKKTPVLNEEFSLDHHKILIILTNLLDNAIKFTEKGFIEIGCHLLGDELKYFVKDTGIGISESNRDIIFEDFRQSSSGLNREYDGIGLGLSLCKAYVLLFGGRIWFDSKEGKGSTFYFTIPLQPEDRESD